jgi:hypothetical protein
MRTVRAAKPSLMRPGIHGLFADQVGDVIIMGEYGI